MKRQVCPDDEGGGIGNAEDMGTLLVDKGHPGQDSGVADAEVARRLQHCPKREESEPEQEAKEQERSWQIGKGMEIRMHRI